MTAIIVVSVQMAWARSQSSRAVLRLFRSSTYAILMQKWPGSIPKNATKRYRIASVIKNLNFRECSQDIRNYHLKWIKRLRLHQQLPRWRIIVLSNVPLMRGRIHNPSVSQFDDARIG